jgi:hypothetical protein
MQFLKIDTTDSKYTNKVLFWCSILLFISILTNWVFNILKNKKQIKILNQQIGVMQEISDKYALQEEDTEGVALSYKPKAAEINKLAKLIQNDGENWNDARTRARILLETDKDYIKKNYPTEG